MAKILSTNNIHRIWPNYRKIFTWKTNIIPPATQFHPIWRYEITTFNRRISIRAKVIRHSNLCPSISTTYRKVIWFDGRDWSITTLVPVVGRIKPSNIVCECVCVVLCKIKIDQTKTDEKRTFVEPIRHL